MKSIRLGATTCIVLFLAAFFLTSSPNATAATSCLAGSYLKSGTCTLAPAGSYVANSGSTSATKCALGKYSASTGATACTSASAGYYVATTGSSSQTICPAGKYSSSTGASTCTSAAAGYYVASAGSSSQTLCPLGKYYASTGATACTSASAGYYVSSTGSTSATKCAVGTYSSSTGASACTSASVGYYVASTGSSSQTACGTGTTTTSTGSSLAAACGSSTIGAPTITLLETRPTVISVYFTASSTGTASYYVATCTNGSTSVSSTNFAASPILVTGLTNGLAYSCYVKAYASSSTYSSASSTSSATPVASSSTLVAPSVNGLLPGDSRISVQFNFIGGKITTLTSASDTPATQYVAYCYSSDGGASNTSRGSAEYSSGASSNPAANLTNPLIVSGLTNGKTYKCMVISSAVGSSSTNFSTASSSVYASSVIPNAGPSNSSGVLSSTVNSTHITAYPDYTYYCNYTNQTATGTGAVPSISYVPSGSTTTTTTTGTSQAAFTCSSSSRTLAGNALPDHLSSKFFTNGLSGYTGSGYNSGNPNKIGNKTISKAVPISSASPYTGTISSAYSAGSSGYDTNACYEYTTSNSPAYSTNYIFTKSSVYFCTFVSYAYANNSVLIEPGTAETYSGTTTTYKVVGKNIYQDVGLDPSNAHNQPTGNYMYGNYHYHGIPEGHVARLGKGNSTMTLVAFASDGFPVYARYGYTSLTSTSGGVSIMKSNYRLRTSEELTAAGYTDRPSATLAPYGVFEQDWVYDATSGGDLDACNGRYGVTPESPSTAVYHYYITDSYPFVQRCVFGQSPSSWANGSN